MDSLLLINTGSNDTHPPSQMHGILSSSTFALPTSHPALYPEKLNSADINLGKGSAGDGRAAEEKSQSTNVPAPSLLLPGLELQ